MAQKSGASIRAQRYYLPPHIDLCALDDGVVVLDQKSRRYYSLPAECRKAIAAAPTEGRDAHADHGESDAVPPDVTATLTALVKRGVLTTESTNGKPLRSPCIATSSSIDFGWGANEYEVRPQPRHVLFFVLALLRAVINLHFIRFDRLVRRVRRRRERSRATSRLRNLDAVKTLVVQFRRLRPLVYSSHDACLFDSLVLLEYLALQSVYPMWVVGVDSRPFRAHSWVQYEDCVLNGTVENVEKFKPILIV